MNNYNQFPTIYKEEIEKQKAEALRKVEQDARGYNQSVSNKKIGSKADGKGFFVCFGISAAIAFINLVFAFSNCHAMFCDMSSESERAAGRFFSGLGTSVIILLIGAAIGGIAEVVVRQLISSKDKSYEAQIQTSNDSIPVQQQYITKQFDSNYSSYYHGFEEEAKRRSVNYAESALAQEVIAWMTNGFCAAIDAFDRRSHVQKIDVPFMFNVYCNKITCNIGTYDFELKRCANLPSALDQAALNRAIAAAIQVNIMMKYPQDVTGTSVNVTTTYSYTKDSAVATLRYEAFNGNYKEVHNW